MKRTLTAIVLTAAAAAVLVAQNPPPATPPPQQQDTVVTRITGGSPGLPPKYAIPEFIAQSSDAQTQ